MSDIVDTSPLGIERTERIAGDDALNSRLDTVTTELQGTQASVTTEVLHRSEGDLVIQRILEGYIQDLLEGKAEDFERYIEFQNSQNLNYADVRNFVSGIRTSLADDIRDLATSLMNNLQANDARYDKLVSDVGRYLEILSDITLDSNQITLDNGELRAGAWTILSQARAWDLEIISRLNGLSESVGDSLKDAVEEIQNQLPSTEETITKAIEELSKSPLIKELSDLLNQSIENDIAYELALLEQARKHANDMAQLAEDMRAEALAKAQEMEDYMAGEVTARITEVNKEVAARKEAIDLLTEDMLTRVDQDKADYQADMLAVTNRIKSAEDGLTSEIQHRKDGDSSTLNALNTYKVSNDSAITGLSTSLSNNVTKTSANTTLITGLTARMTTAETGIESATTAAADAMSKATTAVSANSALATRVDALAASITESEGTVVDVNAFNALKAEVNTVKGTVTGLVEDVTALESNYTSVNNKVTSQGTAISTLNTKMATAENSISQSANDITLLKTDISSVNASLLTKVDSQAFSQLSSDVTELDGKYTTQAGLVTDLRGSLDTTNVNVSNAASAAQNALNTAGSKGKVIFGTSAPAVADRLSQNLWIDTTGSANTPKRWNGSAWVVVTDKVATDALAAANAATNLANTKADTSAFNSLDQKVTVMDGKVSTNTNSITSLNGKIAIVEGAIATKLDSSAMVNYYTKQQADDAALSTAAGKVEEFKATLGGSGVNLFSYDMSVLNSSNTTWGGSGYTIRSEPGIGVTAGDRAYKISGGGSSGNYLYSGRNAWLSPIDTAKDSKYIISYYVKSPLARTLRIRPVSYTAAGAAYLQSPIVNFTLEPDVWKRVSVVYTNTGEHPYIGWAIYHNYDGLPVSDDNYVLVSRPMAERAYGTSDKPSNWVEGGGVSNQVNANSTAIQDTNSEVIRVEGKTTTNANNIIGLTGRIDTVEGQVTTKADASALQNYYTKTEADANSTTVAAGEVAKYDASLVIGGTNLVPNSNTIDQSNNGPSSTVVMDRSGPHYKFRNTSNNGRMSTYTPVFIETEVGKIYTVSLKVRPDLDTELQIYGASGNTINNVFGPRFCKAGEWTTLTMTFKSTVTSLRLPGLLLSSGLTDNVVVEYKEYQLEEGTKATAWSPSVVDVQSQLDANATAITDTNAEVSRVNDNVTANSNSIITLNSSVSNLGNTKLNASVIAGYYTKSETDNKVETVTSGKIESFKSSIENSVEAIKMLPLQASLVSILRPTTGNQILSLVQDSGTTASHSLKVTGETTGNNIFAAENVPFNPNILYRIRYKLKRVAGTGIIYPAVVPMNIYKTGGITASNSGITINTISSVIYPLTGSTTAMPLNVWVEGDYYIKGKASGASTGAGTLTSPRTMPNFGAYLRLGFICPVNTDFLIEYFILEEADEEITANALNTTNTEVSRIDGVVSGHTTQLSNLTASIAGKADTSALNALTVRVAAEEGKSSSQATSITNLTSSLGRQEDARSLAYDYEMKDPDSWYYHSNAAVARPRFGQPATTGGGVVSDTSFHVPEGTAIGFIYNKKQLTNDRKYRVSMWVRKTATATGANYVTIGRAGKDGVFKVPGYTFQHFTFPANGNWHFVSEVIDQTANSAEYPYLYLGFAINNNSSVGWSEVQGFKVEAVTSSSDIDDTVATASALSTLDTQVVAIDGRVTTQASQLVVLTSDNNANKNALSVQGKVIDGVKASYMVKMESNGVIGGFGLIQSTGALGQVVTSFGVNANSFFVGAPASKKQPFIVTTTNQVVNGVTYPAGTYIDVALIANATIGTAKIANLAVTAAKIANATITNAEIANTTITGAKIANATIDTAQIANLAVTGAKIANATITSAEIANAAITSAKIGDLEVDTIKIKDNAVTSLHEVQKAQQQVDKDFPALPTNGQASVKVRVVLLSGLSRQNRYLVYWRGRVGAGMSTRVSNPPPWRGWGRKRLYFGSTSSTTIAGSKVLAENNQLNGDHVMWYQNGTVAIGDISQWNVAEGIVDETGALCLWADVEWRSFADPMVAGSLYAYVHMSELNILVSEFKK